jgi:hypothetical protein
MVKYAYDLVLMTREEKVLQDMIDRLIETGRRYGMEMNVEKTKVMRISRQPSPIKIMIEQKQLENVEYFNYLGSMMQGVHVKLNPELSWQNQYSTRRRLFHQQTGLKFKEETSKMLHLEHSFLWC